jgi:ribose 5-phosphate isomerase B
VSFSVRCVVREFLGTFSTGGARIRAYPRLHSLHRSAVPPLEYVTVITKRCVSPGFTNPLISSAFDMLDDKTLISEDDLKNVPFGTILSITARTLITPLAADLARERNIQFERSVEASGSHRRRRKVAIGGDHGGFEMKEALKGVLSDCGVDFQDFGTNSAETVDYPDFAHAVALAVSRGACDLGIMIDGAGIGSCMVANKVPGIRAAMCYDERSARNSREHNGANVLTLGSKAVSNEDMGKIVRVWLSTNLTEERHRRRVAKIDALL